MNIFDFEMSQSGGQYNVGLTDQYCHPWHHAASMDLDDKVRLTIFFQYITVHKR